MTRENLHSEDPSEGALRGAHSVGEDVGMGGVQRRGEERPGIGEDGRVVDRERREENMKMRC